MADKQYNLRFALSDGREVVVGPITVPAGQAGVSPSIAVSEIAGGHRLTITDVLGAKTVDVMDGGIVTPPGGTKGQVLAKASDAENDLVWKDPITYSEVSNNYGGKTVTIGGV